MKLTIIPSDNTVYVDKVNTIETITEDKNDTCEQMVAKLNDTDL